MANKDINKQLVEGFQDVQRIYLEEYNANLENIMADMWINDLDNLNHKLEEVSPNYTHRAVIVTDSNGNIIKNPNGTPQLKILDPNGQPIAKMSSLYLSDKELKEIDKYGVFALEHYSLTNKLQEIAKKAMEGKYKKTEALNELERIFTGTGSTRKGTPNEIKKAIIEANMKNFEKLQDNYEKSLTTYVKAQVKSGDKTAFTSKQTSSRFTNSVAEKRNSFNTVGVTSISPKADTFALKDTLDIETMPSLPTKKQVKEIATKKWVDASDNNLKVEAFKMPTQKGTKKVFFDLETFGDLGNKNFGVGQATFRWGNGSDEEYSAVLKAEGETKKLIVNTINKLKRGEKLNQVEERTATWLLDYTYKTTGQKDAQGKEIAEIKTAHNKDKTVNLYAQDTINKVINGGIALTSDTYTFTNRQETEQVSSELVKRGIIVPKAGKKGQYEIASNVVLIGQNNHKFDDKGISQAFGIDVGDNSFDMMSFIKEHYQHGAIRKGKDNKAKVLLGYQNEELADFFDVDLKSVAEQWWIKHGHTEAFTEEIYQGLQHLSDWDTIITEGVYKAVEQDAAKKATSLFKKGATSTIIEKGYKAVALRTEDRTTKTDYLTDANTKDNRLLDNSDNKYNAHRLFRSGAIYSFSGLKDLGNNRYEAVYHDEERNVDIHISGTREELAKRNKQVFGLGNWQEATEFDKRYSTQDRVINSIFDDFYGLKKQLELANNPNASNSAKHTGRFKVAENFIRANQDVLSDFVSKIEKETDLTKMQKDIAVKMFAQRAGLYSLKGLTPGELHNYITANTSNRFNSYIKAYKDFMADNKMIFYSTKEGKERYNYIINAIKTLQQSGSEEMLESQGNLFYGLGKLISDSFQEVIPEEARAKSQNNFDKNSAANAIESTIKEVKNFFVDDKKNIASKLYKLGTDSGRLRKNLDGRAEFHRIKGLKISNSNTALNKKDFEQGLGLKDIDTTEENFNFNGGTLGNKINALQDIAKNKGIAMTIVPTKDEGALEFYFYDERRADEVIGVQNGKMSINGDKATKFVLPLVSDEGIMNNNGMNIVNTLGVNSNIDEKGNFNFQITTTQDKIIDNLIRQFSNNAPDDAEQANDPTRRLSITELIKQGDTVSATRSLNYFKKRFLEGVSSVDTYKQMEEANDQLKDSGSLEQKYIRTQTVDVRDALEEIFRRRTGANIDSFIDSNNRTVYSSDIFSSMISHLIMSNRGFNGVIKGKLGKLLGADNIEVATSIEKDIEELALKLPLIDLTVTKGPTVTTAGRLHLAGPRDFRAFADLNSESKRSSAQVFNTLEKTEEAIKKSQELAKQSLKTIFGIEDFSDMENYRKRKINSGLLDQKFLEFAGLTEEEYNNRSESFQYNILNTNDNIIKNTIENELKYLQNKKTLSQEDQAYLKQLEYYQKNMPSVYEGTILTRESETNMFNSSRKGVSKVLELNSISDDFFTALSDLKDDNGNNLVTRQILAQMLGEEGATLDLSGVALDKDFIVSGKTGQEKDAINFRGSLGDKLTALIVQNGKLRLIFDKALNVKGGTRMLLDAYGRTTNMSIADRLFEAIVGNGGEKYDPNKRSDIDILQEASKIKSANVGEQVGGRYEYLFDLLGKLGYSDTEIAQALQNTSGAKHYIKYSNGGFKTVGRKQRDKDGKIVFVDDTGKAILQEAKEVEAFMNPFYTTNKIDYQGKSFADLQVSQESDIGKVLEYFGFFDTNVTDDRVKKLKELYNPHILRSGVGAADEYEYTGFIGVGSQDFYDKNSRHKIGWKEADSIFRGISDAENTASAEEYKAFDNLRNKMREYAYGMQADIVNGKVVLNKTQKQLDLEKKASGMMKAIRATIGADNEFDNTADITKQIDFKDIDNWAELVYGENGSVDKEVWENSAYGKLFNVLGQNSKGEDNEFVSIVLPEAWRNLFNSGAIKDQSIQNLSSISIAMLRPEKMGNGGYIVSDYAKKANAMLSALKLYGKGEIKQERAQLAIDDFLTYAYNDVAYKEGSLFEELHGVRRGSGFLGTVEGYNMADYANKNGQAHRFENTAIIGAQNLRGMLSINFDPLKEQESYNKALNNLRFQYGSLMDIEDEDKLKEVITKNLKERIKNKNDQLSEEEINQKVENIYDKNYEELSAEERIMEEELLKDLTIEELDINRKDGLAKALPMYFNRYPSTNMLSMRAINVMVDKTIKSNLMKVSSGLEKQVKADHDADKAYINNPLVNTTSKDFADYKEGYSQLKKVVATQSESLQDLGMEMAQAVTSDMVGSAEDFAKAYASVAKMFTPEGIREDNIASLVAKTNFAKIGVFSNLNTSIRNLMDVQNLGNRTQSEEGLRASTIVAHFLEFLEEDAISAKKVADRLVFQNEQGENIENDKFNGEASNDERAQAIYNTLDEINSLMRQSFDKNFKEAAQAQGKTTAYLKWESVINKMLEEKILSEDENGVIFGQGLRHFDMANKYLKYRKQLGRSLNMEEEGLFSEAGFTKEGLIKQFEIMEEQTAKIFGRDLVSVAGGYTDGQRKATAENIKKRILEYDQRHARDNFDYHKKQLMKGYEIKKDTNGQIILDEKGLPIIKKAENAENKITYKSFLAQLMDPNGEHEYITDINYEYTIEELENFYKQSKVDPDFKLPSSVKIGKVADGSAKGAPIVSVTSLINQMVNPYTKYYDENEELAKLAIQKVKSLTDNEIGDEEAKPIWTQWNNAENLEEPYKKLVQYYNTMTNGDRSKLTSKLESLFLPVNRGSIQHDIFDKLNKISNSKEEENAKISKEDIENVFKDESVQNNIAKVNKQAKMLGLKDNILSEKKLKAITQAYANYVNDPRNKVDKTLSSETSLGFTINLNGHLLNLVGTADMISATGIRDYKYKGSVHGDLESWQLNLLNKAVIAEIQRSYMVDKNNYGDKSLGAGTKIIGAQGDYLTSEERQRLKKINGVFEQGVLARYTEKAKDEQGNEILDEQGHNIWVAKEDSKYGFSINSYNDIMNVDNYNERLHAPNLEIVQLGTETNALGEEVGWVKSLSFDTMDEAANQRMLHLYWQLQQAKMMNVPDTEAINNITNQMRAIFSDEQQKSLYNTLSGVRLYGPTGKLVESLEDIKQDLGLENLEPKEITSRLVSLLGQGAKQKRMVLSSSAIMNELGLRALGDQKLNANSKEFRELVNLVESLLTNDRKYIELPEILEKYRLEGAKFGSEYIAKAHGEAQTNLSGVTTIFDDQDYYANDILKKFIKQNEEDIKNGSELKERAALFGNIEDKKDVYLQGSAYTGNNNSIDMEDMLLQYWENNGLLDDNGNLKEGADKSKITSLLHTHTSGSVLPSIQDIETMQKLLLEEGYENLNTLRIGDKTGHLLSLNFKDFKKPEDFKNFIDKYNEWMKGLEKEIAEKMPKGTKVEDILKKDAEGNIVGFNENFSLFDSNSLPISEGLLTMLGQVFGENNFAVTNAENEGIVVSWQDSKETDEEGKPISRKAKVVTTGEGENKKIAFKSFVEGLSEDEVIANNPEISQELTETHEIINTKLDNVMEIGEQVDDISENAKKRVQKINQALKEKKFDKKEIEGETKYYHKQGNKQGQEATQEDIKEAALEELASQKTKIAQNIQAKANKEVQDSINNTKTGTRLLDLELRKREVQKLYAQVAEDRKKGVINEETGANFRKYQTALEKYTEDYNILMGTGHKHQYMNRQFERDYKNREAQANSLVKNIINNYETLNSMLQQNAPTEYLTSMLKDLQNNTNQLDSFGKKWSDVIDSMSEEQKAKFIKSNVDNYNNLLVQDRQLDFERYGLEQQMTNEHVFGANTKKQFILNPYRNQVMAEKANMLDLQSAGIQANLRMQEDIANYTKDGDLAKQYAERRAFNEEYKKTNRLYLDTAKNAMKGSVAVEHLAMQAKGMLKTAVEYGVVYRGVQSLIAQVYTIIGSIKEFDTLETQLRLTKTMNKETAASMIKDYKAVADELGTTTQAVTAASVTFLRQGRNIKDTNNLIKQSAILAKVGFMQENEAAELLTATLNGFKLKANEAASVVDLVAYTDTIAATSAQELMTAFQYVASSASVAGIEVEKLNAMIATSSEVTRLSASTIGQAYKTMISRLQQVKVGALIDSESGENLSNVDKMLKQYGIHIMDNNNKMKEGDQILEEFAEKWKSWGNDTAKKREAIEALAGTRQGNIAMSLFDNWDRYEEILSDTEQNARGSASDKMKASTESINTSIARLQNTLKNFASYPGAVGMFKWVVDLTTGVASLSKGLGVLALAYLVIGKNGAGLNAIYNIQIGLVDKLRTSFQSLFQKQELQKQQALTSLSNANIKTISGGGVTAFIDPVTGKPSESIDNDLASRTLAFNAETNFRDNIEKLGLLDTSEGAETLRGQALQGQIAIQRARVNGSIKKGSVFTENLKRWTDEAVVNGSMTEAERNQIYDRAGKLADMGQLNNKNLNEYLLEKNEQGQIVARKFDKDIDTELTEKHKKYLEEHPEALANQEEALVTTMRELIEALNKNTAAVEGNQDKGDKAKNNISNETKNNSEENAKKEIEDLEKQKKDLEAKIQKGNDIKEETDNQSFENKVKREEKKENFSEEQPSTEEQSTKQPDLDATEDPNAPQNSETQSAEQSAIKRYYEKHKTGLTVTAGTLGMIGGSMGATQIASDMGANSAVSSTVGMITGTTLSTLSVAHPIISSVSGVLLAGYKIWRQIEEQKKEDLRQTFNEAQEAFNTAKKSLKEITDNDFQKTFRELSQGVDEFGNNLSLTEEQYEQYRKMVDTLTENHSELIVGYDEEGKALIERNKILEESIKLIKEQAAAERDRMYAPSVVKQQIEDNAEKVQKLRKQYKRREGIDYNERNNLIKIDAIYNWGKQNGIDVSWMDEAVASGHYGEVFNQKEWKNKFKEISSQAQNKNYGKAYFIPGYVEDLIDFQDNQKNFEKERNQIQSDNQNLMKNWLSTQDEYKNSSETAQTIYNKLVEGLNFEEATLGNSSQNDTQKLMSMILDRMDNLAHSSVFGAINTYYESQGKNTVGENKKNRKLILKGLLDQYGEEGFEIAKQIGIVNRYINFDEQKFVGDKSNDYIEELSNYDPILYSIQKRLEDKGYTDTDRAKILKQVDSLNEEDLIEISNNLDSLIIKPFEGGLNTLNTAIKKWKDNAEKTVLEQINIQELQKYTKGFSDLKELVGNYNNNVYKDSNGKYQRVVTVEQLGKLKELQTTFNLTDKQMETAIGNGQGGISLNPDNVKNLVTLALINSVKGKDFTLETINAYDQNLRSLGIEGGRDTAFTEFIRNLIAEGTANINKNNKVEANKGKTFNEDQQKIVDIVNKSSLLSDKNLRQNIIDTQKIYSLDNFIDRIKIDGSEKELDNFKNKLKESIQALGGFNGVLNSLTNSDLYSNKNNLEQFGSLFKQGDTKHLAEFVKGVTGNNFEGLNDETVQAVAVEGAKAYKQQIQAQIFALENGSAKVSDDFARGRLKEEQEELQKSLRNAKRTLEDLHKEAELDRINLAINKMQVTFDKLAKSIQTCDSAMEMLDPQDFAGKFDFTNEQINTTTEYLGELNNEWDRLLGEFSSAQSGEAMQAIGEALSKVSDQITENTKQRLQLQKQLSKLFFDSAEAQFENTKDTLDREANLLDMQGKNARSKDFNYINVSALTNPSNFLPDMNKDDLLKARSLSKKLVEEEKERQQKLDKIKRQYLDKIYAENSKRREEDIKDAQDEVEKLKAKLEVIGEDLRTSQSEKAISSLKATLAQLEQLLKDSNLEADVVVNMIDADGNPITTQSNVAYSSLKNAKKNKTKVTVGTLNEAVDAAWQEYKGQNTGVVDNAIEQQNVRMSLAQKYKGNIKDYDTNKPRRLYGNEFLDNYKINKGNAEEITSDNLLNNYIYNSEKADKNKKRSVGYVYRTFEHEGQTFYDVKFDDGSKLDNKTLSDLQRKGFKVIPNSYAYANSRTSIAKGPITVGEKAPEFVMFKNGQGAIFDKTTILNGNDVDFVSNASYANNGKYNGIATTPYVYGGGEDNLVEKTKETAKKVSEETDNISNNVTDTSTQISENVEEVNTQITTDITDNNKSIIDTVDKSWNTNKKNTNDALWEIKNTTKNSLTEIVELFDKAFDNIHNNIQNSIQENEYEYTGNLDNKYDNIIATASKKYNVPISIIKAIIDTESSGNPLAISDVGAKGLMQLMDETARSYGVINSYDPIQNIMGGTHFLADLYEKYEGDWRKVFGYYNGGYRGVNNPVAETRNFIEQVSAKAGIGGSTKRTNYNTTKVNNHSVTSPYNVSRNIKGKTGIHKGVDLAYNYEPIYANKNLTITKAGWVSGFGNAIYAQDNEGYTYIFGHLDSINVKAGQKVKAGTKLGVTGNTGRSTGPHLHYQVEKNGTTINPSSKVYAFRNNSGNVGGNEGFGGAETDFNSMDTQQLKETYDKYSDDIGLVIDLRKFVTTAFMQSQLTSYNRQNDLVATIKDIAKNGVGPLSSAATYARDLNKEVSDDTHNRQISLQVQKANEYYSVLEKMNAQMENAIKLGQNDSDFMKSWYELHDKIVAEINELNEKIKEEVEAMIAFYQDSLNYSFSYIDRIQAKVEKALDELNVKMDKLRDYETIEKATTALEKFHLVIQKWNTNDNKITASNVQKDKLTQDLLKDFERLGLNPNNQNALLAKINGLVKQNGEVDVANQQDLTNLANNLIKEAGKLIASEEANGILQDISIKMGSLTNLGKSIVDAEKEKLSLDQERNSALWDMVTQNEAYITQAKEERYSLYNAIVQNSEYLKQLVNMQGQLIKDTDIRDKSINKISEYDKLMEVVRSQIKLHNVQNNDVQDLIYDFNERYGIDGIDANNWADMQGNKLTALFNKDKAYLEKLYKGQTVDRSDKIGTSFEGTNKDVGLGAAQIGAILGSMNTLQTLIQERAQTLNNINSSMSEAISMQKDILAYQKELMKTLKSEVLSAINVNSDRNSLVYNYLDKLANVFDTFNRDQKYTTLNSQLQTNKAERDNLITKSSTLESGIQQSISEIYKITDKIDVNSLFTAKGEQVADRYNAVQKQLDEILEDGEITIGQQMTIKNNLDMVEENLKEQVQTNDDIINNYNVENELIEKKNQLYRESYDWQIKKMESLLSLKEKQFDIESKIFDLRSDLDKELRSAKQSTQWLTKSERLRIFNEEDYAELYKAIDTMENKSSDYYKDYYSQMMNLTEDTLYKQEYITAEYQRRMELVEAEYNITQKRVDLEKQQLKLKNVLEEKNTRMYVNGEWKYVANTEDVISNSESLADAETAYKKAQEERLQKIQSAQMSKYIDGLKEIQASIENTTKYTNNTEQELAQYLSKLVQGLVGGDLNTDSVKTAIDTLNTAIFNFSQTFETEVDEDLMDAIRRIRNTLSNEFDEDYIKAVNSKIKSAMADTSNQINDINKNLKTSNEDLSDSLQNLVNTLQIAISQLQMEVSYNNSAYKDVNDVVYEKYKYEEADKRGVELDAKIAEAKKELDSIPKSLNYSFEELSKIATLTFNIQDWEKEKEEINKIKENSSGKAEEKRTSLREQGYGNIADFLDTHNWESSEAFRKTLENTNEKYWNEALQKANAQYKTTYEMPNKLDSETISTIQSILGLKQDYNDTLYQYNEAMTKGDEESRAYAEKQYDILQDIADKAEDLRNQLNKKGYNVYSDFLKQNDLGTSKSWWSELSSTKNEEQWNKVLEKYSNIVQNQDTSQKEDIEKKKEITSREAENLETFETTVEVEGNNVTVFQDGVEQWKGSINEQGELVDEWGSHVTENGTYVDNFGNYVADIPEQFREVATSLAEAVRNGSVSASVNGKSNYKYSSSGWTQIGSNKFISNNKAINDAAKKFENATKNLRKQNYNVKKAASGDISTTNDLYNVDEQGDELHIPSGRLRQMEYGDQIVPHELSENLLKWGTMNPYLINSMTPSYSNNITNNQTMKVNIENITLDNVTNGSEFIPELNRFLQRTNSLSRY